MKLTPKQELFVSEYLKDLNATAAAIRAGYSEKTARFIGAENLTKPNIQEAVRKALDKRVEKVELNADWVLTRLQTVVERCLQAEAITDREGNETGEFTFNANGANKALELIGKHVGMFTDKLKVEGNMNHNVDLSGLSIQELRNIAKQKPTE